MLCNDLLSRAKKKQNIGIKYFHTSTSYGLEHDKGAICKLSIKMPIKNAAAKAYSYRMLLSFKTSVLYKKKLSNFTPDNCVRCEVAFVGHNSSFCRVFVHAHPKNFSTFDQLLIFVNLYQDAKKRFIPSVHFSDAVHFRVPSVNWRHPILNMLTSKIPN